MVRAAPVSSITLLPFSCRCNEMTRRVLLSVLLLGGFAHGETVRPVKLGDQEWMRRFREFVKVFNAFVNSLNDGKVDRRPWRLMRKAWAEMADADE